jgi:hypothetical protein
VVGDDPWVEHALAGRRGHAVEVRAPLGAETVVERAADEIVAEAAPLEKPVRLELLQRQDDVPRCHVDERREPRRFPHLAEDARHLEDALGALRRVVDASPDHLHDPGRHVISE